MTDITFYKDLIESAYETLESSEIDSFTLNSSLNDYWGTYNLIKENSNSQIDNYTGTNIYVYTQDKIKEILTKAKKDNLGIDIVNVLEKVLESGDYEVYVKIIE